MKTVLCILRKCGLGAGLAFLLLGLFPADAFSLEFSDVFLEKPRKELEEKGVSFEAAYTGDMVSVLNGGLYRRTTYIGTLEMTLTLDLGKAGLIPGGKFFVSGNDSHGGNNPTQKYIGDLQLADNLEAPDAVRLYEWWYEQSLWKDKFSVLVGVQGVDSAFAVTEYGDLFINTSFGTPPDFGVNVPVSLFPDVGPVALVRIKPHEQVEFLAGIYDGDPSDGGKNRHGVRYRFSEDQGLMLLFEGAYHQKIRWNNTMEPLPGSVKFGSWLHTQNVDDVLSTDEFGNPLRHRNDYGFYGLIDQMVYREKPGQGPAALFSNLLNMRTPSQNEENEPRGLGVFFQFGGAPDDRNTVDYYFGAGLNYTGLLPRRGKDVFGIAVANAFLSEKLQKSRSLEIEAYDPSDPEAGARPGKLLSQETALETTYRIQLHERFMIQPDYQIIFNPSGEENIKTAHVFILRFEVTY